MEERRHSQVGQRLPVHWQQGNDPRRLFQTRSAAGKGLRRCPTTTAVHPPLSGTSRRMDRSLQNRQEDYGGFQLLRLVDRSKPPRERRLPGWKKTGMGPKKLES